MSSKKLNPSGSLTTTASGSHASITQSIASSKNNILTFDKMCNWYLFENEVLMPMPILNKYKEVLLRASIEIEMGKDFYYKPEYVSYKLYGTTDLWYLLLFLNGMTCVEQFNKKLIRVVAPSNIGILKTIFQNENSRYTRENPKHIKKHYVKHPSLPSDQLLPDDAYDEITNTGISSLTEVPLGELNFEDALNNYYYKGKSKMELFKLIDNTLIDVNEYRYMDGIRISNSQSNAIYDDKYRNYEYKFSGYINLSKMKNVTDNNLKYQFQINGINGMAYLNIDNVSMVTESGESKLILSDVTKEYDFFERKTRNSDFKQRNTTGWVHSHKVTNSDKPLKLGNVATDKKLKKPVFNLNLSKLNNPSETPVVFKNNTIDLIYGELLEKEIQVNLEERNPSTSEGEILFSCIYKADSISGAKVTPFLQINYDDGTSTRDYAFDSDWNKYLHMEDYNEFFILSNILREKKIKNITFGLELKYTANIESISGKVSLSSINLNRVSRNTMYATNLKTLTDWVPFTAIYRHNGNGAAMFNITWKVPGSNNFVAIPRDCIAIIPDGRDMLQDVHCLKRSILVTAERELSNGYIDKYFEILTSKMETPINLLENHTKLRYHTDIKIKSNEKLVILKTAPKNTVFKVFINNKEIKKFVSGESRNNFTPSKYIDNVNTKMLEMIDDGIWITLDIVDETKYTKPTTCIYNLTIKGENVEETRYTVRPTKFNYATSDILNKVYKFQMLKDGISTVKIDKASDDIITNNIQYVMEFDIKINADGKGLFMIDLDRQMDGSRYILNIEYTGCISDYIHDQPIYNLDTNAYKITSTGEARLLSNIDNGIDFYKEPYSIVDIYKNNLEFDDPYRLSNLRLKKDQFMHFFVRKNRQSIILGIRPEGYETDIIIASWVDNNWEELAYGFNTFSFFNIDSAEIKNLKISM